MVEPSFTFGIIGGDLRQIWLADLLIKKNYSVMVYGLEQNQLNPECRCASSLAELMEKSRILIGPIPFSKVPGKIVSQLSRPDLTIRQFISRLTPEKVLFAGCIPDSVLTACRENHVSAYDFMENESLTIANTVATAEGAILEAILHHPSTLHHSKCLILGYGRCARTLADKLKGLSAHVTICARSEKDRAQSKAMGYDAVSFSSLPSVLSSYEYLFNTVPCLIFDQEMLPCVSRDSVIIDIASMPGGVDYPAAKQAGIKAFHCLGLPGKYAPKASALSLAEALFTTLQI